MDMHMFMSLRLAMRAQGMVKLRNANYATISQHLCFGKRGAVNVEPEIGSAGASGPDKGKHAADTVENGLDADEEAPPEPKLLKVGPGCISALKLVREIAPSPLRNDPSALIMESHWRVYRGGTWHGITLLHVLSMHCRPSAEATNSSPRSCIPN